MKNEDQRLVNQRAPFKSHHIIHENILNKYCKFNIKQNSSIRNKHLLKRNLFYYVIRKLKNEANRRNLIHLFFVINKCQIREA